MSAKLAVVLALVCSVAPACTYPTLYAGLYPGPDGCSAQPQAARGPHLAPVDDGTAFEVRASNGAAVSKLCPGEKYNVQISWTGSGRYALLYISQGALGPAANLDTDNGCSSRLLFDDFHGASPATSFTGTVSLPCTARGTVSMAATSAYPGVNFYRGTLSLPVDSTCAAASCGGNQAPVSNTATPRRNTTSTPARNTTTSTSGKPTLAPSNTVLGVAQRNANLSILASALQASALKASTSNASLVATVFAPTNAAFAALLKKLNLTAQQVLASKPLLNAVLSYHMVPGAAVKAAAIKNGQEAATLLRGAKLRLVKRGARVVVAGAAKGTNNATVVTADVPAGRSIVHVINTVLLPPNVTALLPKPRGL